ncbi:hypothetical protein RM863_29270 [Streptomyces sp. DSM 41014]|uniref:Uncharacterized protein n=1 Tax=Streptomyces hintoniae TaxID=3075521 RepID=A0ABU2USF9_9ACTN|nr:hypothetical protein [Streptomyces sp. DSM 41014]MDT0476223.1 hypothetical protein [Streptomyces sp. DSM 41014]
MEIPDTLITLEHAAEEARAALAGLEGEVRQAQWLAWRAAAEQVQAAITAHAAAAAESRYEVERAVKLAVRHPAVVPAA